MTEKKIIESSLSEDMVTSSNEGTITSNSDAKKAFKESSEISVGHKKKRRSRSKSKGSNERSSSKTNNLDARGYNSRVVSSKDSYLEESSTSPLPTISDLNSDVGNAFYTSLSNTNNVKDPVVAKWLSTTTLLRSTDNDINWNFKAVDQLSIVAGVPKLYAIDSPYREVMTDPTVIINDFIDERTPNNLVSNQTFPDFNGIILPRYAHRNYVLNLSGSLPRANSTTNAQGVESWTSSVLDSFNNVSKKGIIKVTPVDEVAPLVNDIGTATTTVEGFPLRHNKQFAYCTRFDKLGSYTQTLFNYGYVAAVDPEYYLSHDQLNKSNVLQAMYDKITEYNINNNSMLRAIVSVDALAVTMNSVTDFTTAVAIIYDACASAIKHQLRIAAQGGAVDSTFANLFLTQKLQLNTMVDTLLFFGNALKGLPIVRPLFDKYLEQSKPFKIQDSDATDLDNMVVSPTFVLTTNDMFNYKNTTITDRKPSSFLDSDKSQSTTDGDWVTMQGDWINSIDPRLTVGFKTTINSVTDHLPHGSVWDVFMPTMFSWLSLGSLLPLTKYSDWNTKTYDAISDRSIKDIFNYLKGTGSGKPNLSLTEPALEYTNKDSVKSILPHTNNTKDSATTVILPMVNSTNMTAFMYSFIKFICDPLNRSFIDKLISNLNRTKLYFKTLQEKIGFFDYYELLDDNNLAKIGFNLELLPDFSYDKERTLGTCSSIFTQKNITSSGQKNFNRFNSCINPTASNTGTTDYDKVVTKHKRATLYIKQDGSTYTDPSRSAIRLIAYDSTAQNTGYTVGNTNAICFNTDCIMPDISIQSFYIGHHILAYYASASWKDLYNLNLDRLDHGWWKWNFYYGRGKNPTRPRFMQRGLVMNTEDGLFQSPILNAYQPSWRSIRIGNYAQFINKVGVPLLSMAVDTDTFNQVQDSYVLSYIRNKTGLWTRNTLRTFLLDNVFNKDKGFKLIKLKYITN